MVVIELLTPLTGPAWKKLSDYVDDAWESRDMTNRPRSMLNRIVDEEAAGRSDGRAGNDLWDRTSARCEAVGFEPKSDAARMVEWRRANPERVKQASKKRGETRGRKPNPSAKDGDDDE